MRPGFLLVHIILGEYYKRYFMDKILVHNLNENGNDRTPSGFDSWKDFWEQHTKRCFSTCSCCEINKAEVGAHVTKCNSYDHNWYIVPLCKGCNNKRGQNILVRKNDLVPVNQ